ncbi:MAG: hypothetical protein JXQ66_03775 [Campylobacterales bacterium]|nr:hypothetical protein [Campylobacterales bacterium]
MKTRIGLSLALSTILAANLVAATQSMDIEAGWNLKGSSLDGVSTTTFSSADTVWTYDTVAKKWNVTSPNGKLTSKITALGDTVGSLSTINSGDGFWVNSTSKVTLTLSGTESDIAKELKSGWNLISFNVDNTKSIDNIFTDDQENKIYTVWGFDNGMWKTWSPSAYAKNLIKANTSIGLLSEITAGKGYWVNTTTSMQLTPPDATLPDFVFVNETIGDGQVANLGGVSIYNAQSGELYGETGLNGKFDLTNLNLSDGTSLKVIKEGYTSSVGTIENGFVMFTLMKLGSSTSVDMSAIGDQKPLKKYGLISTDYATVEVEPSTAEQSITFTVTAYATPEALPKITQNIDLDGTSTNPEEISVIGAANVNLKGSDKKTILDPSTMDGKLNFNYKLEKFIGDLESILNGLTGSTNDGLNKFNPEALGLLETAKSEGLMSFYLIQQQPDGSWIQLDEAIPVVEGEKIKLTKKSTGMITTFGSGNIAYIIKTKSVKGSTEICFTQDGYRMNDGSIILSDENNSSKYDFVGKPIKDLVLIGDQNVIGQPVPSSETGCTTVEYKVPYLSPMYQITAVSEGNFDKTIVVDVEFGNLDASYDPDQNITTDNSVHIYKIPERATIEGYVKSTLDGYNEEGVAKAVVTLQDPQILTKDKVLVDNTNGKKTITLEANPNVTFTYTLVKEDDTETSKVIKSGKISDGNMMNILTQKEIEDIIYGTDAEKNPWLENPYGNYFISIQATHDYATEDIHFYEQMLVSFRAKVDEKALMNAFSTSVNQGDSPWYKSVDGGEYQQLSDENNEEKIGNELSEISIFGGKDISLFKPLATPLDGGYISFPDESKWETYVISLDSQIGTELDTDNDPNPYLDIIVELNAEDNVSKVNLVLPKTEYNKQYMKFSQVYKIFNENFSTLVQTDFTATEEDVSDANDENITITLGQNVPLYQSGFTVFNTYQATFERTDNYRVYAGSYTMLDWFKLNSVDDFSDILDFKVSANEPTAYSARYTTTEDDGFYQINQIDPSIIPTLELTVRAEGHEYGTENERPAGAPQFKNGVAYDDLTDVNETTKLTVAEAGDVLTHNFMLNRIAPPTVEANNTIPDVKPELPSVNQDFENGLQSIDGNWTIVDLNVSNYGYNTDSSDTAKWNVVQNSELPAVNANWSGDYDYETNSTILPTPFGGAYAWMGDIDQGTYSDSGYLHSDTVVATALKSPVIDFSNYSLAVLNFKQWFEVSAYDASFDTAFVGFEIQEDENLTNGTTIKLQDAGGYTTYVTVGQTYIKRVTPETPVINSYDTTTYLSNNGLNVEPSWSDFKLPLDVLAGKKAKIVFGFFTKDTLYNNNRGWGVDNVYIQDSLENALQLPPMVPTLTTDISSDVGIVDNTTAEPTSIKPTE